MKQVLFLCSANFYRSRFAEHLFNWLAEQAELPWRADSRGLLVGFWGDVGPIYPLVVDHLQRRGVPIDGQHRDPMPLTLADLEKSSLVVAVKESEHRRLIAQQFPAWENRVEYWSVDDLDCAGCDTVLPVLENQVRSLIERLQQEAGE